MVGAWGGYSNGQIPASALVAVPGGLLQPDAARAWIDFEWACRNENGGRAISINEGYRDLAGQNYYWNLYLSGAGNVAAFPGTSNHGWGLAVDLDGYDGVWTWMQNNAWRWGWSWATGQASGERWHWEYVGPINGGTSSGGVLVGSVIDKLGPLFITKLQQQLGVTADSIVGPETTAALQRRIGTIDDGDFGTNSIIALQTFVGAGADGVWGDETTNRTREAINANKFAAQTAPDTGGEWESLGGDYVARLQGQLEVTRDGLIGPETISALQAVIGTGVDGVFGPESTKALQTFIGADADGVWGDETTTKFRAAIDANKFADTTPDTPPPTGTIPDGYKFGLDVAYIQTATFDWATIKANHDFVIIKAGGAENPTTPYAPAGLTQQHLTGARSVGLRVGFYWFNNGNVSVQAQAQKFIDWLRINMKPGDFVALDIENDGDDVPYFKPAQALEFANMIEAAFGIKTLMYMNRTVMTNEDWSTVVAAGHPLWMAVLNQSVASGVRAMKEVKWWSEVAVVQYASTLGAPGYAAMNIDANFGKVSVLESLGYAAPPPEPDPGDFPDPAPVIAAVKQMKEQAQALIQQADEILEYLGG